MWRYTRSGNEQFRLPSAPTMAAILGVHAGWKEKCVYRHKFRFSF
jgi:hypothetical protein